ncbi:MAG: (2Fe-2S) ferredoxin domain-containing protein [Pleurocapsa sp. MO_226.B13]|nr:(2Fe-2S) ferredoxin domain-containing protein [Pleurocapsa sp. MO_226.B13]
MESEFQLPSISDIKSFPESSSSNKIIVCRGRSCRKYNSEQVFENFKQQLPPDTELISVPCLGQCGNGPMVLVESEQIWYSEVHPDEVATVIKQHIIGKSPVKAMLYQKFHP